VFINDAQNARNDSSCRREEQNIISSFCNWEAPPPPVAVDRNVSAFVSFEKKAMPHCGLFSSSVYQICKSFNKECFIIVVHAKRITSTTVARAP